MKEKTELIGEFHVTNSTSNRLIGYKVLSQYIEIGQHLEIIKIKKLKHFDIERYKKISDTEYHISNSNISIVIKKL